MFSVTAAELNGGIYVPGATFTFQYTGAYNETQTDTIGSPTTFSGYSTIPLNITSSNNPATLTQYLGYQSGANVSFGQTQVSQGTTATDVYTPPIVDIPATLTTATPVTVSTTDTQTVTPPGSSQSSQSSATISLASNTPVSVVTPIGTFSAYELDFTSGSSVTRTWYAPGYGLVQGMAGSGSNAYTEQLTSFTPAGAGAPTGGSTVTAALSGILPSTVIPGSALKTHEKLTFTAGSAGATGAANATILLSPDGLASDSVLTLGSAKIKAKLKAGKADSVAVNFPKHIPSTVEAGTYDVLIEQTDTAGVTSTFFSGKTITVEPANVDLSGSIISAPTTAKTGKKIKVTFDVTNASDATVNASGKLAIRFGSSPDRMASDATWSTTASTHINLAPGKSEKITEMVSLAMSGFLVVQLDPQNAFTNDIAASPDFFSTAFSISVV